jgi:hypothetical protein
LYLALAKKRHDTLHLLGPVHAYHFVVLKLLANVDICVQTVQDGGRGGCVHCHEKSSDRVREQKDHEQGADRRRELNLQLGKVFQTRPRDHTVQQSHRQLAQQVENTADSLGECEGGRVFHNKQKAVDRSCAEVLTR